MHDAEVGALLAAITSTKAQGHQRQVLIERLFGRPLVQRNTLYGHLHA